MDDTTSSPPPSGDDSIRIPTRALRIVVVGVIWIIAILFVMAPLVEGGMDPAFLTPILKLLKV